MTTWRVGCLCEVYCKSEKRWYTDGTVESIGGNWIGVRFDHDRRFKKVKQTSYNVILISYAWLEKTSFCEIFSKSQKKWYQDGIIIDKGTNWINVRFDNNKRYKKVKLSSNYIRAPIWNQLNVGSDCLIYCIATWFNGVVIDGSGDFNALRSDEWLSVQYYDQNNILNTCALQRHSHALKHIDYTSINPTKLIINGFHPPTNAYFPWTKLHDIPWYINYGDVAIINDKEFLMGRAGIYKFNGNSRKWTLFFKYPDDWHHSISYDITFPNDIKIAYDQITSKLYLWNGTLYIINMNSSKYTMKMIRYNYTNNPVMNSGYLVNTPNEIHIVGADSHSVHLILNKHTEEFEPTIAYKENNQNIWFAVYLSFKQSIVICKGDNLLIYSLKHKVLQKRNISNLDLTNIPLEGVVTKDEKHIIMISTATMMSTIWILDITEGGYYCRMSHMKLPNTLQTQLNCRRIIRTHGGIEERLLVFGYIRDLYNVNIFDYNTIIPIDVSRLIVTYYTMEWLHILQHNHNEKQKHFVIPMQMILKHDNQ